MIALQTGYSPVSGLVRERRTVQMQKGRHTRR